MKYLGARWERTIHVLSARNIYIIEDEVLSCITAPFEPITNIQGVCYSTSRNEFVVTTAINASLLLDESLGQVLQLEGRIDCSSLNHNYGVVYEKGANLKIHKIAYRDLRSLEVSVR